MRIGSATLLLISATSCASLQRVASGEAAQRIDRAKQLSLSLLYWLQTEAPRRDGGAGWKGLRLRPDVVGTSDGLAKYPYIRESRRMLAEFTVREQHVTANTRMAETDLSREAVRAAAFADSMGIGRYNEDFQRRLEREGIPLAWPSPLPS